MKLDLTLRRIIDYSAVLIVTAALGHPSIAFAQPSASNLRALSALELGQTLSSTSASYALVTRPSDRDYTRVDVVSLDPKTRQPLARTPTDLGCARVHAASDGRIYCFTRVQPNKPRYYTGPTGYLFDAQLKQIGAQSERKGTVSRARISADGRFVANTAFTTGHSYLGVGGTTFSTATYLGSTATPRAEDNLQHWSITHQGKSINSVDLNLWGVSFDPANADRFMVTVYFDGKPHLGEGSVKSRAINVLRQGVECPSFSPDGKRIAFKKRVSPTQWIPALLDLTSGIETAFNIAESVDDQIEWLDNNTLIFELALTPLVGKASVNLYTLSVAQPLSPSQAKPSLWLADARSPTFVRR
jgi:hypothetical protein